MSGSLDPERFLALLQALAADGHRLVGPKLEDGALGLGPLDAEGSLPRGWTDAQSPGRYRLERRTDDALFGYASGPHAWKKYLHLPELELFSTTRSAKRLVILDDEGRPRAASRAPTASDPAPKLALVGVRACDLAALRVLDRVLAVGPHVDVAYASRRSAVFTVAVTCSTPGGTCFCASMGAGPEITEGADVAVTELVDGPSGHRLLVESKSEAGRLLLAKVAERSPLAAITEDERAAAKVLVDHARANMGRALATTNLAAELAKRSEHLRWDDVAARCLGCTSCTMVCPTCFCTTVLDTTSIDGGTATRTRYWDSCFTLPFSEIHGAPVRPSIRARYRQWLTHKLSAWVAQFGTFGCVGCGRCITWCPAGIDLVAEARAIVDDLPSEPHAPEGSELARGEGHR